MGVGAKKLPEMEPCGGARMLRNAMNSNGFAAFLAPEWYTFWVPFLDRRFLDLGGNLI